MQVNSIGRAAPVLLTVTAGVSLLLGAGRPASAGVYRAPLQTPPVQPGPVQTARLQTTPAQTGPQGGGLYDEYAPAPLDLPADVQPWILAARRISPLSATTPISAQYRSA